MDFYDYISAANTNEALAIFKGYSQTRVTNPEELSDGLRSVMRNLRNDEKQDFLSKLANAHPDFELMESTIDKPKSNEDIVEQYTGHKCNCPNCQVKHGANGMNAVGHYMSTGSVESLIDKESKGFARELESIKLENTTKKLMNERVIQLVIIAIIGFLFTRSLKK